MGGGNTKVTDTLAVLYCEFDVCVFDRCGYRGGFCELINIDPEVRVQFNKSISAKLCPTVSGQVLSFKQ